jgi:hypothetical protein
MRTAETRDPTIVTEVSGAIGALYADSRSTALQQVEHRVRLFPMVGRRRRGHCDQRL